MTSISTSVDGEYRHAALTVDHLAAEAESWGLPGARPRVLDLLTRVQHALKEESPDARAHPDMRGQLLSFAEYLLGGRPAG